MLFWCAWTLVGLIILAFVGLACLALRASGKDSLSEESGAPEGGYRGSVDPK